MNIPQITLKYFEEVYVEHIAELYRITVEELETKVSGDSDTSLNKRAERYIKTYLRNRDELLTEDNWCAAKELYIQWKLFEEIELEEVSKDKKESLYELLELLRATAERNTTENAMAKFF
jgi:hypothetical protein